MTTPTLSAVLESVDLKEQCTLCTPLPPQAKMGKYEEKKPQTLHARSITAKQ